MNNSLLYFGNVNTHLSTFLSKENYAKLFVLVDEHTIKDCLPLLDLPPYELIQIESGENHKNLPTCQNIWAQLMRLKADRQSLLINLGGGVIGDMGGFCASCFKRGMYFINIPTTLLAMVDASIGGKTGVDFMNQKNMIGCFASALATFIDPLFLATLDERQLKCGKAEMLKHGLIASRAHYKNCVENQCSSLELIKESVRIKENIVKEDPYEKGKRKALNFGHTLGHAIESVSLSEGKDILHGEAVALGMILELKLSVLYAGLDPSEANLYTKDLVAIYGNPREDLLYLASLIDLCLNDKKNENKGINFSLLSEVGKVKLNVNLSREEVLKISN